MQSLAHILKYLKAVINPDPDPAFQANLDPNPRFWWPKTEEKKKAEKNLSFSNQKLQFTYPLSLCLFTGRPR